MDLTSWGSEAQLMLSDVTADSVFVTALMQNPKPQALVLLEGPDDDTILAEHIADGVVTVVAGTKARVLEAASTALEEDLRFVVGLVDRDLDPVRSSARTYPDNVVASSAYDLMSELIQTDQANLRRIVIAHGSARYVRAFEERTGAKVEDLVLELCVSLAAVRLAALEANLPVVLRGFDFSVHVHEDGAVSGPREMLRTARSTRDHWTTDTLAESALDRAAMEIDDDALHCGGHDLAAAVGAVVRTLTGSSAAYRSIESTFMSIFDCSTILNSTTLCRLSGLVRARTAATLLSCEAAA